MKEQERERGRGGRGTPKERKGCMVRTHREDEGGMRPLHLSSQPLKVSIPPPYLVARLLKQVTWSCCLGNHVSKKIFTAKSFSNQVMNEQKIESIM